jgi:hypothetical protein
MWQPDTRRIIALLIIVTGIGAGLVSSIAIPDGLGLLYELWRAFTISLGAFGKTMLVVLIGIVLWFFTVFPNLLRICRKGGCTAAWGFLWEKHRAGVCIGIAWVSVFLFTIFTLSPETIDTRKVIYWPKPEDVPKIQPPPEPTIPHPPPPAKVVKTQNVYEGMTNLKLANEAMALVEKIQRLRNDYEIAEGDLNREESQATGRLGPQTPDAERRKLFFYYEKRFSDLTDQLKADYYAKYRISAKMIREAMLDRVSPDKHDRNADASYEDTGYVQMPRVTDDLETLAKTLNPNAKAHP